jgi:hypothetical protein
LGLVFIDVGTIAANPVGVRGRQNP